MIFCRITYITFFLFVFACRVDAQDVPFKALKIYPFQSLNWQNFGYHELLCFDSILKKNDLLVFAERTHHDGGSYDAACMILKGLIDSGKIKNVFIESSWLNVYSFVEHIKKFGKDSIKNLINYTTSSTLQYWYYNGFWDYMAEKIINGKINLVGYDMFGTTGLNVRKLFDDIPVSLSEKLNTGRPGISYAIVKSDLENIGHIDDIAEPDYPESLFITTRNLADTIIQFYEKSGQTDQAFSWSVLSKWVEWRYHRNFSPEGKKLNIKKRFKKDRDYSYYYSVRDSLMAAIFSKCYRDVDGKSVVLATSYHGLRNAGAIEKFTDCCKQDFFNTMFEILDHKLGAKIYSVCFATKYGKYGIVTPRGNNTKDLTLSPDNSFENYFGNLSSKYFFTDLKTFAGNKISFVMNPAFEYMKANWGKVYSGVFFIKEMYPMIYKE